MSILSDFFWMTTIVEWALMDLRGIIVARIVLVTASMVSGEVNPVNTKSER